MNALHLINDDTPSFILEMIFQLKVKDVMTRDIMTADRQASLKTIQHMMKAKAVTGIPIEENKRLFGIVSLEDIIRALEGGYIEDTAEKRMTRNLIVLEEDMPLSFAINYMDKYRYGRFPVLNISKELVGIITSRDIINKLLLRINEEMTQLENRLVKEPDHTMDSYHKTYICHRFDFENAGRASTEIKKYLKGLNLDRKLIRRVAVASYELEINLVVHSQGGTLHFEAENDRIRLTAADQGPGIGDVDQVMKEGYSTANDWIRSLGFGAGMGLPNVKRVSDEFAIKSKPGVGTTVISEIVIKKGETDENK
ncbi:MAG: CBS domain-containing protein [Spirochaetales bacterium]|nr:CBS domain-containing protein [Spirochaetales bacterium]